MLRAYQRGRHRAICAGSADRAHGPCLDERSAAPHSSWGARTKNREFANRDMRARLEGSRAAAKLWLTSCFETHRSAAKLMETPATRPRCDAPQHERASGLNQRAVAHPTLVYSAATRVASATGSTFAAQYLNSGIFPNGSSAGVVSRLAAASTK